MNKSDLIDAMAEHAGITKAAAKKALECMLIEIEGALQKGNRVSLVGFGSWSVTRRAAREGIPYQTLIGSVLHKYVSGFLKEAIE